MDDMTHDIQHIQRWAASNPIIVRVWIFGSRVRGTNRPDSDLDVAIEHDMMPGDTDHFTTALGERSGWVAALQPNARCKLDVWSYRPGETPIVESGVKAGARLIYERAA
jgi:predicted nucleotidyltransferase